MPYLGELFALGAALFWAVGVILFKRSGEGMSPLALNLFKNLVGVILVVSTIPLIGERLVPDNPATDWLLLAASGVIGIAVADTFFFMSLERLGAGLTAVVDTSYTPIMLLMASAFLGEELGLEILSGGALIMLALIIGSATRPPPGKTRRDIVVGIAVGVTGIVLMGLGIVMIKGVLDRAPHLWATGVRLAAGAAALIPIVLLHPQRRKLLGELRPSRRWRIAVPASFFGTYLAMVAWLGGMKYTEVSAASLLNQLSTIFIFILATAVLREPLTRRRVGAIALAFSGAMLVLAR
jgi:drug/metabolite transporter (DMT)-like permease